jgi:hypothetical protein
VRAPLAFVYGNLCFGAGEREAWALFVVRPHAFDGLTGPGKREAFGRLVAGIEATQADLQLLRLSLPFDPQRYADELDDDHGTGHEQAHRRYLDEQRTELSTQAGRSAWVAIAVRLVAPEHDVGAYAAAALERSPRRWLEGLGRALAWQPPRVLSVARLESLRFRADEAHARLAAYLNVRPARTVEVQWLVRRAFCRGLGEPVVDGLHEPQALVFERNGEALLAPLEADVLRWMDGCVEHHGRWLRIDSELGTSWQAQLVVGALPEQAEFPSRRLALLSAIPDSLPFAVDLTLNARYLPNDLAVRLVHRRVQDADQILHAEGEGDQGVSDQGYARTQAARDLLAYLQSASRPPLLRSSLAVAVAARDPEELERRVAACRRAFGEIALHRPLGDQLDLFCQHLPGQPSRARGYDDTLTVEQVAAMMPTAGRPVGTTTGFYLGHTLTGSRSPVRFDLREGSRADRPTTVLSVGSLGAGKTILTQALLYHAFLAGARIVDTDPKGDHRFHRLDEVAPHVQTITLRPDPDLRGLLDPLRIAPEHLRHDAAVSFLSDLLPARCDAAWLTAIVRAVDAVAQRSDAPTCGEVIRALGDGDAVDEQVSQTLAVYARTGLTQLGFAAADGRLPALGREQVTYIALRDLPAPEPGTARSEYSQAERVAEQIVRLLALLAMHLMASERDRLKVFAFDEGWRLLHDPAGRLLLAGLQRMGRSELAVPIIGTQLVTDTFDDRQTLDNLIGATFAFAVRSDTEARRALGLLGLDSDDEQLRRTLLELRPGQCLMRDHHGRVEAVQIDLAAPRLLRALSTRPAMTDNGDAIRAA